MKVSEAKYNRKKKSTLSKRNCGFELTFEEFKTIYEKATTCDYTGVEFSNEDTSLMPSLERVDKNLPYRKDNCIIVTTLANQIKDIVEEGTGRVRLENQPVLEAIQETLKNKTREELVSKYFPKDELNKKENTTMNDVIIAKDFIKYSEKEVNFNVSFSKFKSKLIRKTCEITGKVFDEDNHYTKSVMIKKDHSLGWSDDNIQVVCLMVANILKNELFTGKELEKLSKIVK